MARSSAAQPLRKRLRVCSYNGCRKWLADVRVARRDQPEGPGATRPGASRGFSETCAHPCLGAAFHAADAAARDRFLLAGPSGAGRPPRPRTCGAQRRTARMDMAALFLAAELGEVNL